MGRGGTRWEVGGKVGVWGSGKGRAGGGGHLLMLKGWIRFSEGRSLQNMQQRKLPKLFLNALYEKLRKIEIALRTSAP